MTDSTYHGTERIGGSERIASLDVLRGIAILFILFMNIAFMAGYLPAIRDPRVVSWTSFDQGAFAFMMLLLGTQRGLLEILFGAGIMIMARNAMTPDGPVAVADLHYRRNWLLVLLGLFNAFALFWAGDILLPYGLTALLLFQFRMLSTRSQLLLAAVFLALSLTGPMNLYLDRAEARSAATEVAALERGHRPVSPELRAKADAWDKAVKAQVPIAKNPEKQEQLKEIHAKRTGPFLAYARAAWDDWLELYSDALGTLSILCEIAGTMLVGMALFRLGIIQGRASPRVYIALLIAGYAIGVPLRLAGIAEIERFSADPKVLWLTLDVSRLALTLGHIGLIQLALMSRTGQLLLRPFQAAGKIPLTTYLFTSFLMTWVLMPGFGLGLHGRWGYGGMMTAAAVVIVAEIAATNLWLRWYETGPMEWIWKCLAYQRRMPFRRRPAPPTLPPGLVPAE